MSWNRRPQIHPSPSRTREHEYDHEALSRFFNPFVLSLDLSLSWNLVSIFKLYKFQAAGPGFPKGLKLKKWIWPTIVPCMRRFRRVIFIWRALYRSALISVAFESLLKTCQKFHTQKTKYAGRSPVHGPLACFWITTITLQMRHTARQWKYLVPTRNEAQRRKFHMKEILAASTNLVW